MRQSQYLEEPVLHSVMLAFIIVFKMEIIFFYFECYKKLGIS